MDNKKGPMVGAVAAMVIIGLAAPAHAGFMAEQVDEGIYLVSYERGRWTAGSILDTARKAQRKLVRKSNEFCLDEGYSYMRFPSAMEIGQDERLRAAWEIFAGDEASDSFQTSGGDFPGGSYAKTHKTRRILILSDTETEGFDSCGS